MVGLPTKTLTRVDASIATSSSRPIRLIAPGYPQGGANAPQPLDSEATATMTTPAGVGNVAIHRWRNSTFLGIHVPAERGTEPVCFGPESAGLYLIR